MTVAPTGSSATRIAGRQHPAEALAAQRRCLDPGPNFSQPSAGRGEWAGPAAPAVAHAYLVSNPVSALALTGCWSLPSRLTAGYKTGLDGLQVPLDRAAAPRLAASSARGGLSTVNGVVAVRCA